MIYLTESNLNLLCYQVAVRNHSSIPEYSINTLETEILRRNATFLKVTDKDQWAIKVLVLGWEEDLKIAEVTLPEPYYHFNVNIIGPYPYVTNRV